VTRRLRDVFVVTLTAVLWAAGGAALILAAAVVVPNFAGGRSLKVLSGSMEPGIHTGDMVIGRWMRVEDAKPGQVITFRKPGASTLITHRVRSVRVGSGVVHVVTKGDANQTVEDWRAAPGARITRGVYRVPKAGYVVQWIQSGTGRYALVVIPAVLLALWELWRIWRREPREPARA